MATYALSKITPAKVLGSQPIPMAHGPEKASQSWLEGALLLADTDGYLVEGTDNNVIRIAGIAAGDASGVTGADAMYFPALPGVVFEGTLEDQASAGHALAQTDLFACFALYDNGAGLFALDENDGTNVCVRIIDFVHNVGDVRARVHFTFLADTTIFGNADS